MSASDLHPNLQPMFEEVLRRNPGESEFHQAVFELIHSLTPIAGKQPEYIKWSILNRICEPERQIIFRVRGSTTPGSPHQPRLPGAVQLALGPFKGGLRFHSVNLSIIKFLG